MTSQNVYMIAAGFYFLSLMASLTTERRKSFFLYFLVPGLLANSVAVGIRYWTAWPMLPMYLDAVALPLCLALLILVNKRMFVDIPVLRFGLALIVILSVAAVLFPKDYYLPFLKSATTASHLFFWFGVAGKGCFLICAAIAGTCLLSGSFLQRPWLRWAIWGFVFWTLCMFSGVLWSYLGWGAPVVWDDAAITLIMATWFFYIGLLHLHLTGTWSIKGRSVYAASGAVVVVLLNFLPALGPFRWPF